MEIPVLLALVVLGSILIGAVIRQRRLGERARSWPAAKGTVVRSGVNKNTHRDSDDALSVTVSYSAAVSYKYMVRGRSYECDRVSFGGDEVFTSESSAQARADRYRVGASVTVFHDPANPKLATLRPGARKTTLVLAAGLLLAGIPLLFLIRHWIA